MRFHTKEQPNANPYCKQKTTQKLELELKILRSAGSISRPIYYTSHKVNKTNLLKHLNVTLDVRYQNFEQTYDKITTLFHFKRNKPKRTKFLCSLITSFLKEKRKVKT